MNLLDYNPIHYNEVIYFMENEWKRKLTQHEINVLLYGYRFGRYIEMENNYIKEAAKNYVGK